MTFFDIELVIPELFIVCSALLLLLFGAFQETERVQKAKMLIFQVSVLVIFMALWQVSLIPGDRITVLNNLFIFDEFARLMKMLVLCGAGLVLIATLEIIKEKRNEMVFELPVLLLMAVVGMMVMISANDLITLYMGLEMQSLALYVMAAMDRESGRASEAGLKYFILGALSSGILLYGCSLIYGFTGTTNFTELAVITGDGEVTIGLLMGIVLVITGLCFKISAAPFHMWTPDVYEGVAKPVTAFFATAPKVAAIALLVRFVSQPFGAVADQWQQIIIFMAVLSMIVGSFGALKQTNIKRLMAYSAIGHIGFILVGLAAGSQEGIHAVLTYTAIYVFMSAGVFVCIFLMKRNGEHVENISDLSGLASSRPIFSIVITILMLSMAGIPPLAGFFGKFFVFYSAVAEGLYVLAVIGALTSVVAAFYYLRIIKVIYFDSVEEMYGDISLGGEPLDKGMGYETKLVLTVTTLFNLLFFVYPVPLLDAAQRAAHSLF